MDSIKTQAFNQGLYAESATQKEALGTLRITSDGRKFRYAKAGAAFAPGVNLQPAVPTANHINLSAAATARGSILISVTVGATAVTANQYKDGYLQINAGTANTFGAQYRIKSHGVSAAGSEAIIVEIDEPLVKALVATTDKLSLIPNPFSAVAEGAVQKGSAGITPIAITSGYYFWAQTGGVACALVDNAVAIGSTLIPAASGALKLFVVDYLQPPVGYLLQTGVTSNAKPVFLTID